MLINIYLTARNKSWIPFIAVVVVVVVVAVVFVVVFVVVSVIVSIERMTIAVQWLPPKGHYCLFWPCLPEVDPAGLLA